MTCARCAEPAKWRVVLVLNDFRRREYLACDWHQSDIYATGLAAPWCRGGWRDPIAQPKPSTEAAA